MRFRIIYFTVFFIAIFMSTGCVNSTPVVTENDARNIGDWSITVEVVGKEPFQFTDEDAANIGPVEIKAAMKDGESLLAEDVWQGILLYDFLAYIGVTEFSVISIVGADGSSQELDPSRIDAKGTGLGWEVNGEKLDETRGPVQLINHNRGPKWWIARVSSITIIK